MSLRLLALLTVGCGQVSLSAGIDGPPPPVDVSLDATAPRCAHTFCDDFDRSTAVELGWTEAQVSGGSLELAPDRVVSAPTALKVIVGYPVTGTVHLTKRLPVVQRRVRVQLALELESASLDGEVDLVRLSWGALPPPCTALGFFLVRTAQRAVVLQETYAGCGGLVTTPIPFAAGFHDVVLEVDVADARVQVRIDDALVIDVTPPLALPRSVVDLSLGAPFVSGTSAPWTLRIDDVAVDVE